MLNIEVCYGTAQKQKLYYLHLPEGTTARQAAIASPVQTDFPHAQPQHDPLGIFGKRVADHTPLRNGDRVEIYRPLLADPKQARRNRVNQHKKKP